MARALALLSLLMLLACGDDGRRPARDAGGGGADTGPGTDAGPGVDAGPRPDTGITPGGCTEMARWIYLVDSDDELLRYEPDTDTLTTIGTLACPGSSSPFSMSVDRNATAWVLHQDHRIYQVSTADASCSESPFVPDQMGFELFGMGFVADAAGSASETLFISGGPESGIGLGSSTLGRIDVASWTVSSVGSVGGSPGLTGTGEGELWGFFPDATPMSVQQLDKGSAAALRTIDVSEIEGGFGFGASAWAFAFWGGRFYIFYQGTLDDSTGIYRVTPDTGAVETVRENIGYRIVGAGVSTCAPTELI
ncbi:MAG: hypothetical protein CMN31_29095 [Sandaracinus sp.]|nr:hypothetical protein [Sandaracinus sp.]